MRLFILGVILLFQAIQAKQIFISYSQEFQSEEVFKYFHSMENEFFVDIGGYDPLFYSNSINLVGWRGVTIEANNKRHHSFLKFKPQQANLNMALTNDTGGFITLFQFDLDAVASVDPNFINEHLSAIGLKSKDPQQLKVHKISLADLCHKYYPKKPKLMSLDIEGHGLVALRKNDWTDVKCVPQVLFVERIFNEKSNNEQRELLEKQQYVYQKTSQLNQIYIHKSVLQYYRQRQAEGVKLLANMIVKPWFPLFQQMFKTIAPTYSWTKGIIQHIDLTSCPIYVHFVTQKFISIEAVKAKSRFLSNVNRPILLINYNPHRSKLFFGSHDFTIKEVKLPQNQVELSLVEIKYSDEKVLLYVLNHNIVAPNPLQILDKAYNSAQKCGDQDPKYLTIEKFVEVDNQIGN